VASTTEEIDAAATKKDKSVSWPLDEAQVLAVFVSNCQPNNPLSCRDATDSETPVLAPPTFPSPEVYVVFTPLASCARGLHRMTVIHVVCTAHLRVAHVAGAMFSSEIAMMQLKSVACAQETSWSRVVVVYYYLCVFCGL
jgi:hypothetical protein